jgi:hypothetical protein
MEFIETPINPHRVGKAYLKMSQTKSTVATPEVKAPKAKYNKTRGEHFKDIVIAMLITGIIAFIGGMTFQTKQQHAIEAAVQAIAPTAHAEAPVKK